MKGVFKDENIGFWQWVKDNPRISIIITEGAKKAASLLSAGYAAIALPGIYGGYRNDDGNCQLILQLEVLCAANREFVFAFDSDKKLKTKEHVTQAIVNTGKLIQKKGCKASVIEWDADLGKGVDDLLVSKGADYFELLFEERLRLKDYEESKKKKTVYLDSVKLMEFLKGEFDERLSFNTLRCEILLDGKLLDINSEPKSWFVETYDYNCGKEDLVDHLVHIAKKKSFDLLNQYLNQCRKTAARVSIDNLATRYFGTKSPLYDIFAKKWLIGAVARALSPKSKFDTALLLQGGQGACKTTFFETLGGEWFDNSLSDIGSNKSFEVLHKAWIHELQEFECITSKKEAGEIKAFLSKREDHFRKPYDKEPLRHPRRSAICGTVNGDNFLVDETGNRRFWIIPLPVTLRIDIKMLEKERDGIWASAVDAFLAGEQWWLTEEEEKASAANNTLFEDRDVWESEIEHYLVERTQVSVSEIMNKVFSIEPAKQEKKFQMRITKILVRLGWKKGGKKLHQEKRQPVWHPAIVEIEKGTAGTVVDSSNSPPTEESVAAIPPAETKQQELIPDNSLAQPTQPCEAKNQQNKTLDIGAETFCSLMTSINLEMNRLGWDDYKGKEYLKENFGKSSRYLMSEEELFLFRESLRQMEVNGNGKKK